MRIAEIVPIWERVPPPKYGGTQRIASLITEGLVKNGHTVTLFATGDSKTKATLVASSPKPLYREGVSWENHLYPALHYYNAFERAEEFDVIHCHIDRHTEYLALPLSTFSKTPVVFTLHFRLPEKNEIDRRDRRLFLERFRDRNYISISDSQRRPLPQLNFIETVYNGIDTETIPFHAEAGKSLIWLGRISHSKGTKEAIQIAKHSGWPLILAGKIDTLNAEDVRYYEKEIKPHLDGKKIRYIGEVDAKARNQLFAQAAALLNPIQWEEPFGLVPAEAMTAGVPVIAFARGAMPEIIQDGVTGFLVSNVSEAVKAMKKIPTLNRRDCRTHIEKHFSASQMVANYEKVFAKVAR